MFAHHAKKRAFTVMHLVLLLSALAVIASAVLFTGSYLKAKTPEVPNEFTPVQVTCQVEESFDGETKKDVCIRNTGDVAGFIRATVVFNWVAADGTVLSTAPQESVDYSILWGDSSWMIGPDGFWYYNKAVAPQDVTTNLIRSVVCNNAPDGYQLRVQIVASAIQADPSTAAETAWGVRVNGHNLSPI